MTQFRVLLIPGGALRFLEGPGSLIRDWATAWRGSLAVVCDRKIVATVQLRDVKPVRTGPDHEDGERGWLWCFEGLRRLETPLRAPYYSSDKLDWLHGQEPVNLASGENAALLDLLNDTPAVTAAPVAIEPEPETVTEAERPAPVEAATVSQSGQLGFFGDEVFADRFTG